MNMQLVKSTATRIAHTAKHKSPAILVAGGIAGMTVATVIACKKTLYLDEIVNEGKETLDRIHAGRAEFDEEKYTDKMYKADLVKCKARCALNIVKLYSVPALIGGLSVASILWGHKILTKRNAALGMALMTLDESFSKYRSRIADEYGEDVDNRIFNGKVLDTITVDEIDENGKKHKKKQKIEKTVPDYLCSPYVFIYDDISSEFEGNPTYDLQTLLLKQRYWNEVLQSRQTAKRPGYVFLEEILKDLDIPTTKVSHDAGFTTNGGDGYIDFGIFESSREGEAMNGRAVNGVENVFVLNFNCQGNIRDAVWGVNDDISDERAAKILELFDGKEVK